MAIAAYVKKVRVSTTGDADTWMEVPATSPSMDFGGDVVDSTDLGPRKNNSGGASSGYRARLLALHDWSVTCDSNYDSGDAALDAIRMAKMNRTKLYVQYLPSGIDDITGGWQGKVVVENFNLAGDIGGLETASITLQANGPLDVSAATLVDNTPGA